MAPGLRLPGQDGTSQLTVHIVGQSGMLLTVLVLMAKCQHGGAYAYWHDCKFHTEGTQNLQLTGMGCKRVQAGRRSMLNGLTLIYSFFY